MIFEEMAIKQKAVTRKFKMTRPTLGENMWVKFFVKGTNLQ